MNHDPTENAWQSGTLVAERYEVVRRITAGGMGEVFEARDVKRELPVALKRLMLDPHGSVLEQERRRHEASVRLHREAIHTSRLGHPGIVNVWDLVYDADSTPVLVMELLRGATLQDHLAYSTLPVHVAIDWLAQVLDALAVAHANGVVHRDLKPANLFLVEDPAMPLGVRVKVLDFGVSKHVAPDGGDDDQNTAVTMTNVFLGSYQYASPEQFDPAKTVSPRSDLYAVGLIAYRALAGRHPAGTKSVHDLMLRTIFGNIDRSAAAHRPDVPPWLDAVIQRALAVRPEDRYRSAEEMRDALLVGARGAHPQTPSAPPVAPATPHAARVPAWKDPRTWFMVLLAVAAIMGWAGWIHARFSSP